MRILMIAHVGETLGHVVRGIAIAEELRQRGVDVHFAASEEAGSLLAAKGYLHHPVRWTWSHNASGLDRVSDDFLRRIQLSVSDASHMMKVTRPDLVVGLPGIVTRQAAQKIGIPHVSVLHGPYLAPLLDLTSLMPNERKVIELVRRVCRGPVNQVFLMLERTLGFYPLDYDT